MVEAIVDGGSLDEVAIVRDVSHSLTFDICDKSWKN